jgi:hypothetical protein
LTKISNASTAKCDWVRGDILGLMIPGHSEALHERAAEFLTEAFRASGALAPVNRVVRITQFDDWEVGGTGRKLLLSLVYEKPAANLPTELFVKFSRNFEDPIRDAPRFHMESEVRLAALSRTRGFPVAVPRCLFADFHRESGTGVLITARVAFGTGTIEPQYHKCRDYEMPEQLAHYRALIRALARLAGTHKAGRLPGNIEQEFPFNLEKALGGDRIPYNLERLQKRVARYAEFAANYPQLLPQNIRSSGFIERFSQEAPRFLEHELLIRRFLHSNRDLIALCHWNANSDNAWFWRDHPGELQCGLLDWGSVGQMPVALALWGCLSGAERQIWDDHLDELLAVFVVEFRSCGAQRLDAEEVRSHLIFQVALMGLAWLLDAPLLIEREIPDLHRIVSRFDPRFTVHETSRVQLHIMTNFLNVWETRDLGMILDRLLGQGGMQAP